MLVRQLLICTSLLVGVRGYAQQKVLKQNMFKDLEVTNSITKSYQDSTCSFHLKVIDTNYDADLTKRYFWFHQGEVKSTVGNYTGKLLHGPYEKYDRDGTLLEKGNFQYGLKDGTWLTWFKNGTISRHFEWKDGERNGTFEEYYTDGTKWRVGTYKNNKLNKQLYQFDVGGHVTSETRYRKGEIVRKKEKKAKSKKNDEVPEEGRKSKKNRKRKGEENITMPSDQQPVKPVKEKTKKKRRSDKETLQDGNQPLPTEVTPIQPTKKRRMKKNIPVPSEQPVQSIQ